MWDVLGVFGACEGISERNVWLSETSWSTICVRVGAPNRVAPCIPPQMKCLKVRSPCSSIVSFGIRLTSLGTLAAQFLVVEASAA